MERRGFTLKEKLNKKGVSPVIATVLLVAMVIVLALIVFLWFRSLSKEAITKFDGQNIETICDDVSFSSEYSSGTLTIANLGNVPIFGFNVKISDKGSHETKEIKDVSTNWPTTGLNQGGVFTSEDLSSEFSTATQVILMPVLVGTSKEGEKTHACQESQGQELAL
ncbi:MAG: archaellin/type IV pilin N-terminal domain-containing protein [Nanoarchaeota archaeon]